MECLSLKLSELDRRPLLAVNDCRLLERLLNFIVDEIYAKEKDEARRREQKHQDESLVVACVRLDARSHKMRLDLEEDAGEEDDVEHEAVA